MGCGASLDQGHAEFGQKAAGEAAPPTSRSRRPTVDDMKSSPTRMPKSRMSMKGLGPRNNSQGDMTSTRRRSSLANLLLGVDDLKPTTIRILVTGPRGSGKATLLNLIRICSTSWEEEDEDEEPFTQEEKRMYRAVIRANIVEAMRSVCMQLRKQRLEAALAQEDTEEETEKNQQETVADAQEEEKKGMTRKEAYQKLLSILFKQGNSSENKQGKCTPVEANIDKTNSDESKEGVNDNDKTDDDDTMDDDAGAEITRDWRSYSPLLGEDTNKDAKILLDYHEAIERVWMSKTARELWGKRRVGTDVVYGHRRYLDDIVRIQDLSYEPTTRDLLWARLRRSDREGDVTVEYFHKSNTNFEVYNIGDCITPERRKYIENMKNGFDAVVFVAALSDYNQTMKLVATNKPNDGDPQTRKVNRMIRTLEQFRALCKDPLFRQDQIALLLTKKDVFAERLLTSDIVEQGTNFLDYQGPLKDFEKGVLYFVRKFRECLDDRLHASYVRITTCSDTKDMNDTVSFLMDVVQNIIVTDNLRQDGFLR